MLIVKYKCTMYCKVFHFIFIGWVMGKVKTAIARKKTLL